MTHHQHQGTREAYGQRTAGTSQFGGAPTSSGTGQQTGSPVGPGTGQGASQHTGMQTDPAMGQVQGGTWQMQQGMGRQMGMRLSDVETPQQRAAVEDVARAIQVCEWCADQCIQEADPGMIECIRLCRDVSELGETALVVLPRNSRYADAVLGAFEQAVEACGQECGQHHHGHCQECAEVLGRTSESIRQLLGRYGGQGGTTGQQTTTR